MKKIRLTKLSGEKLLPTEIDVNQSIETSTLVDKDTCMLKVGLPFITSKYTTSPIKKIVSENVFETHNSTYKWEFIE